MRCSLVCSTLRSVGPREGAQAAVYGGVSWLRKASRPGRIRYAVCVSPRDWIRGVDEAEFIGSSSLLSAFGWASPDGMSGGALRKWRR